MRVFRVHKGVAVIVLVDHDVIEIRRQLIIATSTASFQLFGIYVHIFAHILHQGRHALWSVREHVLPYARQAAKGGISRDERREKILGMKNKIAYYNSFTIVLTNFEC